MNIGMILDNEFTGDLRVENEVTSLVEAGFNVYVLCFNHGTKEPIENFHGAHILRLKLSLFAKNKMKGFANTIIDPFTKYWSWHLMKLIKKYDIQAIHAHDLYMLGAAFKANKSLGKKLPVIADLHENYPEALKNYKFTKTFPGKVIVSIPKWFETEMKWVNKADHVITVIEEANDRYKKMGVQDSKMTVVANYVNEEFFISGKDQSDLKKRFENDCVIFYAGGFDIHRGLESAIKSIPIVLKEIPNIKLVLVGAGRIEEDLKELSVSLNIEKHVVFEGWQKPESLPGYISVSQVCLIPHLKNEHTDNTIPHKLFQYMLLEKPVLSSNCIPIERILKDSEAGVTYQSNDENDFADKLLYMIKNPDLLRKMGINGKKAIRKKYNWAKTSENLIQLYKQVFSA